MTKRYISATVVSLNVIVSGKYKRHICFDAAACSGSSYTTDDEAEQEAIESHPKFGHIFKLDPYYLPPVKEEEKEAEEEVETTIAEVAVSSLSEARDYLAENFGVARTKMRSRESIISTAGANNVHFIGI